MNRLTGQLEEEFAIRVQSAPTTCSRFQSLIGAFVFNQRQRVMARWTTYVQRLQHEGYSIVVLWYCIDG